MDTPEEPPKPILGDSAASAKGEPELVDLTQAHNFFKLADQKDEVIVKSVDAHVSKIAKRHFPNDEIGVLILYDEVDEISNYHSNAIYRAASALKRQKDLLLVLHSDGGRIEPAYLTSRVCKKLAREKFFVAVPRRAKSAATLIALGADEIHMGLLSELGPIDPQIGGFPALALTNALNKIADLACQFPNSAQMWAAYLNKNLSLRDLGYFDRVSESAAQYAERLLLQKRLPDDRTPPALAKHFVDHYKDHGFVIDSDEALQLLGSDVIKTETKLYAFSNELFEFFDFVKFVLDLFKDREFYYVGSDKDGFSLKPPKDKSAA